MIAVLGIRSACSRGLTFVVCRRIRRAGAGCRVSLIWVGVAVHDVLFVLLTIGVFVVLALVAKGAEKL
jgi:hypothetical protein